MENILKEILREIKTINNKISNIDTSMDRLDQRMDNLEKGQEQIIKKLDATHDQVVRNTESIENINITLSKLSEDVDFLKYEEHQTKQDIYILKRNLHTFKQG